MKSVSSLPAMMSAAATPTLANFTAMTASRPAVPSIQCNLLFYDRHHVYSHKKYSKNGITIKYTDLPKHIRPEKGYSSSSVRGTIYCSNHKERNVGLPSDHIAVGAKVIYAAAPAMGHNQVPTVQGSLIKESHPECNSRVPAILTALEKMNLTSKFRGSDVVEVQNFRPATTDDIGSVHVGPYISGLEKAMDQALEKGLIFIDGSGPTYATSTTFQESLLAAGAGISLVDSVVAASRAGSYPGTGKIDQIGCGSGEGSTLNLPLPGGSGDTAMRTVFDEVIVPCAQRFKPDIILVSAGYDAHLLDPLASLQFTTGTYYMLASSIKQLAKDLCGGRCVFFLEGGYNLSSLSNSVAESFRAFLGDRSLASVLDDPSYLHEEPLKKVKQIIEKVKHIHSF
ncbi:histone deacetylase 14 isoform X3 [Solanum pennellii]|uniref:Histone deacetylase 14 isoform X3 n=1 Tax=Solanum pennellii TaxID=28526 RepID=A0ABM1FJ73_SOLPN|nr:histone deacetylase 14 isoform X3 [Solanum pennellii]